MLISVKTLGAAGDGKTDDSAAIAKGIALLKKNGGGTLVFESGIYLSGTQRLCDNMELRLEAGAVLKALPDLSAYERDNTVPEASLKYYLLHLDHLKNVTITGPGMIDGSGPSFWEREYLVQTVPPLKDGEEPPDIVPDPIWKYFVMKPKKERIVTIYASGCSNLTLRDLQIRDAAAYTVWMIGSEWITIRNLHVHNRRSGPNTDVLDIDCCRNVRISDCYLAAGDDSIALKSDPARTGTDFACENITVTNCVLRSSTCGIRIGYEGDAPIRNCVFSNLTISDTATGIDMLSLNSPCPFAKLDKGTPIEHLLFQNIIMHNVGRAFFLWAGNQYPERPYEGCIRDIHFSGIHADGQTTSWIGSQEENAVSGLVMDHVKLRIRESLEAEPEKDPTAVPGIWSGPLRSGALVLRGIHGVTVNDLECEIRNTSSTALHWKDLKQFRLNGVEQAEDGSLQRV